jgi:hypothetical protein
MRSTISNATCANPLLSPPRRCTCCVIQQAATKMTVGQIALVGFMKLSS